MVELYNLSSILLLFLLFITVLSLIYFNFDVFQPSCIFNTTFAVSMLLEVLNIEKWNLFVGSYTTVIVILGVTFFFIGSYLVHNIALSVDFNYEKNENAVYKIRKSVILIGFIIMCLFAVISCHEAYIDSIRLGNNEGISNMIKTLRFAIERGNYRFSRWMTYRNLVATSICSTSAYLLIYNIVQRGKISKKDDLILALPAVSFIPFLILTTGRRSFVHFIIMYCIFYGILFQRKHKDTVSSRLKLIKILVVAGVLSISFYFFLGHLTGKVVNQNRDHLTIISHYGGLSIPALDRYLDEISVENQNIGPNILKNIYGNLNRLGINVVPGKDFLPFVKFTGKEQINTNVYTVFYRQITDLSTLGMLTAMVICGIIITGIYEYLKRNNRPILLILYGWFGYIPFFLFIDDQFMTVIATSTVYCTIMDYIYFKMCVIKDKNERT